MCSNMGRNGYTCKVTISVMIGGWMRVWKVPISEEVSRSEVYLGGRFGRNHGWDKGSFHNFWKQQPGR